MPLGHFIETFSCWRIGRLARTLLLVITAVFPPLARAAEPGSIAPIKLPGTILELSFDDGATRRTSDANWSDLFSAGSEVPVASAYRVESVNGYRGKGLKFNGESSHVKIKVPLAAVKLLSFRLYLESIDEPFSLISFHESKAGFNLQSAEDLKKFSLSWFSKDEWHAVAFDHSLQAQQWQHLLLSFDWAAGRHFT